MSYWSCHPEKLEEVTIECLPLEWRDQIEDGSISINDIPGSIVDEAMMKGTEEYSACMADQKEKDR